LKGRGFSRATTATDNPNESKSADRKVRVPICTLEEEELEQIAGISDPFRLDRELDHLRTLGLIENQGGFATFSPAPRANIQPSALALYFYAKCSGHAGTPVDFYDLRSQVPQAPPGA